MSRRLALVWLLLVAACGDDGGGSDAGTDAARDAGSYAPASPVLTPCPTGWIEQTTDGVTTCSPWATPPPETCGVDEGVFPGEEGCVRIGSECPAGDFPEGLPTDRRIVYVLAGAPPGGNGRIDAPFATITSSFGSVFANTIVAIGKGTYDEIVQPGDDVTLWGACAAETILTSSEPAAMGGGVIEARTSGAVVRNLRIGASERNGILCRSGCSMTVEDVVVEGSNTIGVAVVFDSDATLRNVVIRDTRTDPIGEFGRGLDVEGGARATVSRLLVERNHEVGIASFGEGSTVTAEDVYVRDTLPQDFDDDFGRGVSAELGGHATLSRTVLDRNHDTALFVNEPGSSAVATDLVIRDTQAIFGQWGRGINVQNGTSAELHRVLVENSVDTGIFVAGDATLTADDVVVRDTSARAVDGAGGVALVGELNASLSVTRALLARSRGVGVLAYSAQVNLTDVTVRGVAPLDCSATTCSDAPFGIGIASVMTGGVTASSFSFSDADLCGVLITDTAGMMLSTGEVRGSQIGACIQVPGFDVGRLTNEVSYVDNGANLDTTELPVPEPFVTR